MLTYAERPVKTVMTAMIATPPGAYADLERLASRQAINASYRRLACGIVNQAIRDSRYKPRGNDRITQNRRTWLAIDAREWLAGPGCVELLEALGIEGAAVAAWVDSLPALARPDTPRPAEESEDE